jgi:carboxynorspermidine decarboxylase
VTPATPYYLIDEKLLRKNLRIIRRVRDACGAKSLLALKCFSAWAVFPLMREYMDGTTSSSLHEVRLGAEKFGGETHAYSVAWAPDEIGRIKKYADTIIFNSASQLERYGKKSGVPNVGVRINPGVGCSHFDLANPSRRYSRLGISGLKTMQDILPEINGCMFHFNCENSDFKNFSRNLGFIAKKYGNILKKLDWISLGGGIAFTGNNYPLDAFCALLKNFSKTYGVRLFLEPGEAAVTGSARLMTTVLDIVHNDADIAIVDASMEAHTLDHLIYRTSPRIDKTGSGPYTYIVAGRSCLAGDVFGTYRFRSRLKTGSSVAIADAAGYTMVKKNWFNGLPMPSIVVRRLDGRLEQVRSFTYKDFRSSLS